MKKSLNCVLVIGVIATAILGSIEPVFARGGAASIMNSPGYQRRLQESRQEVSQPAVPPASIHHKHKPRHHQH